MQSKKFRPTLAVGLVLSAIAGTIALPTRGQVLQTIHPFQVSDGSLPLGGRLLQAADNQFYGTTYSGGANGVGTVYQVTAAGVVTTLAAFNVTNGRNPYSGVVQGTNGNFYGTTDTGGPNDYGTVFQVTAGGVLTTLASFDGVGTGGRYPRAGLVQFNGDFYGTTYLGGINTAGTVFKVTAGGVLTTLAVFNQANGSNPLGALVQVGGNFYGTTASGGANNLGTVFQVTPAGVLTTLFSFDGAAHGAQPLAELTPYNGDLYGTTSTGGANNLGTIFKITPNGTSSILTTLVTFSGANGSKPYAGLTLANDGNFYGTTFYGGDLTLNGAQGWGTVFQMTLGGTLTTLASFNSANGRLPYASLLSANDGYLYGTTQYGGTNDWGTVFRFETGCAPGTLNIAQYAGLTVNGSPGCTYRIDYTTNLTAPVTWTPLATNTLSTNSFLFIDTNLRSGSRFYRSVLQ